NILLYIVSVIVLLSCEAKQSDSSQSFSNKTKDASVAEELKRLGLPEKLDFLIDNLVLSDNMIMTLSSDTTIYNATLLNNNENAKLYTTSRSKAVNLGVYGADLNYLIHFGQSQFSIKYMVVSKQLADQIGVAMAFDQETMDEYQSNVENKDSLINIIFLAYDNVKKMLKSEDQFLLSTLVIVGSWIENMYITTELLPYFKSRQAKAKLATKIVQQHDYLQKMIELLSNLNEGDNMYVNEILQDLKKIDAIYVSFGDKLLVEDDIKLLNTQIEEMRLKIIKVQ
ncbi:MAG TPA: hypothetical protein P5243_00890, partial [Bacteroidales bacterium]|nr:hypothetical protein [Bacteroidales bacterium]